MVAGMRGIGTFTRLALAAVVLASMGVTLGRRVEHGSARHELAAQAARIDRLERQLREIVHRAAPRVVAGTAGIDREGPPVPSPPEPALVEAVAAHVQRDLGLVAPKMLRERRASFVELYATDARGTTTYGTAGYLGDRYFITVKHGVVALQRNEPPEVSRKIESVRLKVGSRLVYADVVDTGDARSEVDRGDWAILRARAPVPLPALRVNLHYAYPFADPIVRLGNDYSKGIIAASGYVGELSGGLVTCLTDGHPGVSGGGVLNQSGDLVGIPVGRMQGDYRFSFILPLRSEMFRKVPGLSAVRTMATASR
jgi:hypothetical protein